MAISYETSLVHKENKSVQNEIVAPEDNFSEMEQILVVLMDIRGVEHYTKIVITDVDMMLSLLIAHDINNKLKDGIYSVRSSSANDLVSHKLILK